MNFVQCVVGASTLAAVCLASTDASAEVGTAPFNPSIDFRAEEFPFESGFIPSSGPLRVNLTATPYQDVSILMLGDGDYDFENTHITFIGDDNAGVFANTLGAEVTVIVSIDFIIQAEFEVGIYSIEEDATAMFTPYVLPGADPRPIEVSEDVAETNLVDEDFTVPGFDYPGNLLVDFHIEIPGISYQSTHIDITDEPDSAIAAELGVYDVELEHMELTLPNAQPEDDVSVYGELNGTFSSEIAMVFDVTVTVTIADNDFAIGPFEIRIDYPLQTDAPVVFEPEELRYTVPAEPPAGTTTGEPETTGDDSSNSDSDSDSDGGTTTDLTTASSTGDDGDTDDTVPADGFGESDTGCACTTHPADRAPWGLALLGLLALRRRRR